MTELGKVQKSVVQKERLALSDDVLNSKTMFQLTQIW